jgi:glycosyltransferase involved in cell wall biosynthesis
MSRLVFTVVTESFNQAEYLERTIQSVIAQRGMAIEYIMVDPGSTDRSREIIERYKKHFAHVLLEPDSGPSEGLNRALALATGDYFLCLNGDDEIAPNALREAEEYLAQEPVDVLYGNGVAIDPEGNVLRPIYSDFRVSPDLYARGLGTIIEQAALVKIAAIRRVGGFNLGNRTCWDGELFFDIARSGGRFKRVWRNWGRFRIYPASISGSGRQAEQNRRDRERIRRQLGRDYDSPPQRLYTFGCWLVLRLCDWRRWPSYLHGRFRPLEAARRMRQGKSCLCKSPARAS